MVERSDPASISVDRSAAREGYLAPFSDARVAVGLAVATLLAVIFFNRFPQIDILVSQWFFELADCPEGRSDVICGRFPASIEPRLAILRDVLQYTPVALTLILAGAALAAGQAAEARLRLFARGAWTAVGAMLLSALVLVNLLLKEISGRPRPVHTDIFGGANPFVEAGRFADYCQTNCSFVSGEASGAFWLVCLVPLAPRRLRWLALALALSFALLASGLRIAFGGHYLSDAVIAGLLTLTVFALLATIGRRAGWYEIKP